VFSGRTLVTELTNRGVTAKSAAELVQQHPAETIQLKIEVFDWLVERQDKRVAKSPEGYLVKSIRDDYKAPNGFASKADREQQAEAIRQRQRTDAEKRRRKQEQEARERAERQAIDAHWESLTKEQQAELQARADAQTDPEQLAKETGPLKSLGKTIRRHAYIRQFLRDQGKLPPAEA
jgi:hypothetical protein